jgi:hypothetical protein
MKVQTDCGTSGSVLLYGSVAAVSFVLGTVFVGFWFGYLCATISIILVAAFLYVRNKPMETYCYVKRPYTFVLLREAGIEGWGFSKCNPVDKWDQDRGFEIAYGRALKDLHRKLRAMGEP